MSRRNNLASLGHSELTRWGDRRSALGVPTMGPMGRICEEGAAGAAIRPDGTHSDPTMAGVINDETVYETERAVQALSDLMPEVAEALVMQYVRRQTAPQERVLIGQQWVGAELALQGKARDIEKDRAAS